MIEQEGKASHGMAARILLKLVATAAFGFLLATGRLLPQFLVPVGIVTLAMAAGWLDAVQEECRRRRFFPSNVLNACGTSFFEWRWLALALAAVCAIAWVGAMLGMEVGLSDRVWQLCKYAAAPLALTSLAQLACSDRDRFAAARAEIKKAEVLVRQLACAQAKSDGSTSWLGPLVRVDDIPLYKLGSVARVFRNFVASAESSCKVTMELAMGEASQNRFLSAIYAPFGRLADDLLLWEGRDLVLYGSIALYFLLIYFGFGALGSLCAPLCLFVPFLGRNSRAARHIMALRTDIWLAQGRSVEKKGGLTPDGPRGEERPVLHWPMVFYVAATHTVAIYAMVVLLFFRGACPLFGDGVAMKWQSVVWAFVVYVASALGITAGVHRLWAHRSYKACFPLAPSSCF